MPYKAFGYTFVPLRFLCEVMGLELLWLGESDIVLLSNPEVDPVALLPYMRTINADLLKAVKEFEGPYEESIELTVSFYYTSKKTTYTASGYPAEAGTIAADLSIPFGTRFHIPELSFISPDGVFTVKDRGRRVTGNNIDIFVPNSIRSNPDVSAAIRRGRFTVNGYMLAPNE
jgi:3D (Asp-Asp-Asp) domain-containing protein